MQESRVHVSLLATDNRRKILRRCAALDDGARRGSAGHEARTFG
jgi:hypothetical protein